MTEVVQKNGHLRFLDRNYCIASHVTERLDEIENGLPANFRNELHAASTLLNIHLKQADLYYDTIGATSSFAGSEHLIEWMESLFADIHGRDGQVSSIALLDYLAVADKLLEESAKLAQMACAQTPDFALYNTKLLRPIIDYLENQAVGV